MSTSWPLRAKASGQPPACEKRGRPDAAARLCGNLAKPKVATFCAALWPTFTLPLTAQQADDVYGFQRDLERYGKEPAPEELIFPEDHPYAKRATTHIYAPASDGKKPSWREDDTLKAYREGLKKRKLILGPETNTEIDEMFSALFVESPWLRKPLSHLWQSAKLAAAQGYPGLKMAPVILVGPAGCGKTYLAERIAKLSELPSSRLDFSSLGSNFSVSGAEYTWRSSSPGEPVRLELVSHKRAANPISVPHR